MNNKSERLIFWTGSIAGIIAFIMIILWASSYINSHEYNNCNPTCWIILGHKNEYEGTVIKTCSSYCSYLIERCKGEIKNCWYFIRSNGEYMVVVNYPKGKGLSPYKGDKSRKTFIHLGA